MYWFGYRVVELDGTHPGSKCLLGPFESYELAKQEKQKIRAKDMEHTALFKSDSKEDAKQKLESESFNRL